jgi:hypothetical protein
MRRVSLILPLVLGMALAFPLVTRANEPVLRHHSLLKVTPGEVVTYSDTLIISRDGMPTVVFDGASGFADDETVVATIALHTVGLSDPDEYFEGPEYGSIELLSSPTITGTTPTDWTTGGTASSFEFSPAIEFRWTAASGEELGCDDPAENQVQVRAYLTISATLVGSKGTMASFAAEDFRSTVLIDVTCPEPAPTAETGAPATPALTPPPTDTVPLDAARSRGGLGGWLPYLVLVVGAAVAVTVTRVSTSHRS